MSLFHAIILGVVQGLTEFLPVSSSAHLTLASRLLGLTDAAHPEILTAQIAVMQLGTLAAVLVYFRKDIINITGAFLKENIRRVGFRQQSANARAGWYVIIGTLPIVTIGLALKKIIEGPLTKNLIVIACGFLVVSVVMEVAERIATRERDMDKLRLKDALAVGFAQCLALIPGSSRSGTTISAGLLTGMTRPAAARFSFLLSIPAVAASGLLEFWQQYKAGHITSAQGVPLALATAVAFISGYAAIAFLLRFLRTRTLRPFVIYRVTLGLTLLALVLAGIFSAQ